MQQADRVVGRVVGAERIGTDEFGETVGAVCFGRARWAHLVQHDVDAGIGDLPCGLGTGQAAADNVDDVCLMICVSCHGSQLKLTGPRRNA